MLEKCSGLGIVIFLILLISVVSVNTIIVDGYDKLISRADIFYIPPEPNSNPTEIRISELSNVRSRKNIKIIIHGYWANMNYVAIQPLRFAYLNKGLDSLYMADYRDAAEIFYLTSRYFVERLGRRFGKVLDEFMKKHQIYPEDVHLLGHSLGAHIAGRIGRYFNGRIGRISGILTRKYKFNFLYGILPVRIVTGLDPAGPLFDSDSPDALRPTDALFVDAIHSGSPTFGTTLRNGQVDFYPNYGVILQPGCGTLDLLVITSCSHFRAPLFYAESILLPNNFPSIPCSLKDIQKNNCEKHKLSKLVMMGELTDQKTEGTFYLKTNNVPPYGMGYASHVLSQSSWNNGTMMARTLFMKS